MQPVPISKYTTPSIEDIIYMAGLFDGEGCVGIYLRNIRDLRRPGTSSKQYMMYVQLVTTYEPVSKWIVETFSGGTSRGGDKVTSNPKHATSWRWKTNSRHARWFLELIVPYLKIKKEQALVAIEFQKHVEGYDYRRYRKQHRGGLKPLPVDIVEFRESVSLKLKAMKASDKQYIDRSAASQSNLTL